MMEKKFSGIYKYEGKNFRYNYERSVVQLVWVHTKAERKQMDADNAEWQAKHGRNLWDLDEQGVEVLDAVGLARENWRNRGARDEYLFEWCQDLNYLLV